MGCVRQALKRVELQLTAILPLSVLRLPLEKLSGAKWEIPPMVLSCSLITFLWDRILIFVLNLDPEPKFYSLEAVSPSLLVSGHSSAATLPAPPSMNSPSPATS